MDIVFDPYKNRMTNMQLCRLYMDEFVRSRERRWMLDGEAYYRVDNPEIMSRKMYRYREDKTTGQIERVLDKSKPNNKRAHGFMHLLVEDKVNYLLAKPYTLTCEESEEYLAMVQDALGKNFQDRRLMRLGVSASNAGIAWLHPYLDEDGGFRTVIVPPEQGIPLWRDNDHEELDGFIWFYDVQAIEGQEQKTVTKVEYWLPEAVAYYVSDSEGEGWDLRLDSERYLDAAVDEDSEFVEHFCIGKEAGNWGRVPFVPFKNNDYELPDLKFVKSLIDGYDKARSDVANFLDEVRSIVYALKGYGGHDLGEFMRDLNYFRAISLDEDGGAEAITAPVDIAAAKDDFDTLRKDIYDFGQGVDKNSDKLGNSPSGIALKFIYSGLDLKCNRMENAFKAGMEQLFGFADKYLELIGAGAHPGCEIDVTFNRDIAINESQAITDCAASKGIISDETIIKNHPWVEDAAEELERLNAQREAEKAELSDMFPPDPDDEEGET